MIKGLTERGISKDHKVRVGPQPGCAAGGVGDRISMDHGIFGTNSGFGGKWCTTRKVVLKFLFFMSFLLVLAGLSFWRGDWALGFHSWGLDTFLILPNFLRCLKSFDNS